MEVEVEVEVMRVAVVTELTVIFHDFSLFTLFHYQCPDIYYTSFHLFHNYVIFCVSLLLFIKVFVCFSKSFDCSLLLASQQNFIILYNFLCFILTSADLRGFNNIKT